MAQEGAEVAEVSILEDIDEQIADLCKRGAAPTTLFLSDDAAKEWLAEFRKSSDLYRAPSLAVLSNYTYRGLNIKPMPDVAVTADRGP